MTEEAELLRTRTWRDAKSSGWLVRARITEEGFERLIEVWSVVSAWGRWTDEDLGDWPTEAERVAALPDWFTSCDRVQRPDFANLDDDLHDREWIVVSVQWKAGEVEVLIEAHALPLSVAPLRMVIEAAGGVVVSSDFAHLA